MLLTPDVCGVWIHWIHFLLSDLYLICFVLLISESYREGLLTDFFDHRPRHHYSWNCHFFSTSAQNHSVPKKGFFFFFWANSIYIKCSFSLLSILSIFSLLIMKFKRCMENECNYPSILSFYECNYLLRYFIFKQFPCSSICRQMERFLKLPLCNIYRYFPYYKKSIQKKIWTKVFCLWIPLFSSLALIFPSLHLSH